MRVLFALANPPRPEGEAPARCALAQLRGLAAHGIDVHAVAACQPHSSSDGVPKDVTVDVVQVPPEPPSWRGRLGRVRRPRGELAGGEFARRVRDAARDAALLHVDETQTAWADEGVATPTVLAVHYLVRRDQPPTWPWRRELRRLVEFRLAERAAFSRHRYLVANSEVVAGELRRQVPSAEVVVAPLTLDPRYYPQAPLDGPPVAAVVGTGSWPTTRAAVGRLVERVWPRVRAGAPDARLVIAGRGMDAVARSQPQAGIEVVGEIDSAPAFLRGASLLLFPLERGSGMKVKVLEAIACGLPVVTTAAGAEGVAANDGVLVHEGDEELARAAAELLRDEAARRERGAAARRTFGERYVPERATEPLVELYARMAAA